MTRTPHRVLLASVLSLGTLVGASACSLGAQMRAQTPAPSRSAKPAPTRTTPPSSRPLTEAQAHAALVTEGDLGAPWGPTQGVATWRDGVLKATAQAPDCRRLLDALYTDDLFGAASGPRAVTGLDDSMDQAQLRYQVLALSPADVDRTLAWMKTLPATCGRFTAVTDYGSVQDVQVSDAERSRSGTPGRGCGSPSPGGRPMANRPCSPWTSSRSASVTTPSPSPTAARAWCRPTPREPSYR